MQNVKKLIQYLVHPLNKTTLKLLGNELVGKNGEIYPLRDSIPRFLNETLDTGQKQVQNAFSYKWQKQDWGHEGKSRNFYLKWVRESFDCSSGEEFFNQLKNKEKILDAETVLSVLISHRTFLHPLFLMLISPTALT
jgi:uncharacterized protein YbaR (Trm112 family)